MPIRRRWSPAHWLAWLTAGPLLFLDSCDPTLRTTVEDGIIDTSSALLGSTIRAFINVALEAATQNS